MMNIMVIEVFKTNVTDGTGACMLVTELEKQFPGYSVNFDLDDCDRVMRVVSEKGNVDATAVIDVVRASGYQAEVMSDDVQAMLPF